MNHFYGYEQTDCQMDHIRPDCGRENTKVSCIASEFMFQSTVGEWRELLTDGEENLFHQRQQNYTVEIQSMSSNYSRKYFVDQLARESFFDREMVSESKIHEETKVLFLTAAALAQHSDFYTLGTLVPVVQHTPETKMKLINFLKGAYDVTVNGVTKRVVINENDFDIVAEGAAAVWDLMLDENGVMVEDFLTGQTVRWLEMGKKTINFGTISNKQFIGKRSGTLQYGTLELENATELAGELTEQTKEQFSRKVIADVSKPWVDLKKTDLIVLAGGGMLMLGDYFKEHFQLTRSAPDIYANARGARKMRLFRDAQVRKKKAT